MIKIFVLTLLVISIAVPLPASAAKIYVWRNEKGILVFSDTPRPGAEEVKTKTGNVIQSSTQVETEVLDISPQVSQTIYEVIINTPQDNATIRDNTGSLYISGGIKPKFKSDFKVQLYLDGKPHLKPQKRVMYSLHNVDRGEHKIKMDLIDDKGKVIASSKPVTFYMHRVVAR